MKSKITKRDLLFFFTGVMTLFFVDTAWNWESHVKAFKKGFNDAQKNSYSAPEKARIKIDKE